MNLQHLKYAVEIARTGSIRRSAENLYMAQPNLSNALKELEADLGIRIFNRSNKGVTPTKEGEAFLTSARAIVAQMEQLTLMYRKPGQGVFRLRFACHRSSNMAAMMCEIIGSMPPETTMQIQFMETSTPKVMEAVTKQEADIGKIAFQRAHYAFLSDEARSRGLVLEPLWQMKSYILVSQDSHLAKLDVVPREALKSCTEIIYGDYEQREYPNLPGNWKDPERVHQSLVSVYERSSLLDLLSKCPDCYTWVGATHADAIHKHNLAARPCESGSLSIVEALIYRKDLPKTEEMLLLTDWIKAEQYTESFRSQEPFSADEAADTP